MTSEPRTPLTLEFQPDNVTGEDTPEDFTPIVVCEPSFSDPGRIYLGVNPVGHRLGVHLLPEEARRIRDHLTKLLMEQPGGAEEDDPTEGLRLVRPDYKPKRPESIQSRLERAVDRAKAAKPEAKITKGKRFQFRLEFRIGSVQGVIGRLS